MTLREVTGLLKSAWRNISIEPVGFLYCVIVSLSGLPGEELYLKKGCRYVSLN